MCMAFGQKSRAAPQEPGDGVGENAKPRRSFAECEALMRTRHIDTIRGKIVESYCDRPEIIAAVVHNLTSPLLGRKHARETQLRWLMMDVEDT